MKRMCVLVFMFASFGVGQLQAQDGFDYLVIHLKENTVVMERVEQNIVERLKKDNVNSSLVKSKSADLDNTAKQLVLQGWEISVVTKEAYYFRKKRE
jgi:hypothetical protein